MRTICSNYSSKLVVAHAESSRLPNVESSIRNKKKRVKKKRGKREKRGAGRIEGSDGMGIE